MQNPLRRARTGPALALALAVIGIMVLAASPARADEKTSTPGVDALVPATEKPGTVQPNAVPAENQYVCNDPNWASIAAEPGGLVIGNCAPGTLMYRSWLSNTVWNNEGGFQYNGGYINGTFQGCGWIRQDRTSFQGIRGRTNCTGGASRPIADFAYYVNCGPGVCQDGSPLHVNPNCTAWGNVRPWLPHSAYYDDMGPIGTDYVLWRYVTVDNRFVMVHVPGTTKWRFLSGSCITNGAELTSLNPYGIAWYH